MSVAGTQHGATKADSSIIFFVTEDWYFWSHRKDLALYLKASGYRVTIATRISDAYAARIKHTGLGCENMPFRRSMGNPIADITTAVKMARTIRKLSPDIVHLVALKPILLGALSVFLNSRVKFIYAFAGLGYIFTAKSRKASILRFIVSGFLRVLLARPNVFALVQNHDDQRLIQRLLGPKNNKRVTVLAGSGVDTEYFHPTEGTVSASDQLVVMPARVLIEKGCIEFLEAAKLVRKQIPNSRFAIVGGIDRDNPGSIDETKFAEMAGAAGVEWWGHIDEMNTVYDQCAVVCLPSYREGLPKALLEAAACGKPMVATDVSGCREVCVNGITGILVEPRNTGSLAAGLIELLRSEEKQQEFGRNARMLAEQKYSVQVITEATQQYYKSTLSEGVVSV